ncbi:hypothetical protein [Nocardiopsis sp. FR26]|uniref:hypothetical protein n=1 Tax=Nocardiopsis sp. FR26 TaxID=2605987 RepID=UPI001356C8A0|nr:hypothetical protein [Nocardiopsis sp. FR26]
MGTHRKPELRLEAATLRATGRHHTDRPCSRRLLEDLRRTPPRTLYTPRHARQETTTDDHRR